MENQVEKANETNQQVAENPKASGGLPGKEKMTLEEYYRACRDAMPKPFGMEDIPNDKWHDEWD